MGQNGAKTGGGEQGETYDIVTEGGKFFEDLKNFVEIFFMDAVSVTSNCA